MKKLFEKKITKLVHIIDSVKYGYEDMYLEDEDGENYFHHEEWRPVEIWGRYDPEFADRILRRAQGKLFHEMKQIGMPLYGWNQFDRFTGEFLSGKNLKGAYCCAQQEAPEYRVRLLEVRDDDVLVLQQY